VPDLPGRGRGTLLAFAATWPAESGKSQRGEIMTTHTNWTTKMRRTLGTLALASAIATPVAASTETVKLTLFPTGADADTKGTGKVQIRSRRGALSGKLDLRAYRLAGLGEYQVTLDGVRIGTLRTSASGNGKARFRTDPKSSRDQLLGVDPRGRALAIADGGGALVLTAAVGTGTLDGSDVRCCLPDDSGVECEDRTAAECAAAGGVDLGPGSCLPNPCDVTPPPDAADIVCCLPDDSGPECEDRTTAECSAQGGIAVPATSCLPNPCPPLGPSPDADIRCCLPDDSGPECEDRTAAECAAQGGVNIGPGACLPNPCMAGATTTTTTMPGATTTTTLPGGGTPVAIVICERRAARSRASVNGNNLPGGSYTARLSSGGNAAASPAAGTIGDQVEFDFDSAPDDIAAGATPIGAGFLQGTPPQATGDILDAANQVVASATVTCSEQ
jgi:hypothetical protein